MFKIDSGQAGVTLIEVVLSLFLIGVLTAIALPVIGNFVDKAEATAFVLELEADIDLTQRTAVSKERFMRLRVVRSGRAYYVIEQRGTKNVILKTVSFPKGVTVSSNHEFIFDPIHNYKGHAMGDTIGINFDGRPLADLVITPISVRTRVEWK